MMRCVGVGVGLLLAAGCTQQQGQTGAAGAADLCAQSAELGRTIASSAKTPDEARAITEHAIQSNAYPALGNKVVASVGGVVIMGTAAGMTPDQIHQRMLTECQGRAAD